MKHVSHWVGREGQVAAMSACIAGSSPGRAVITGPSGIGKSALAAFIVAEEFARAGNRFPAGILWIDGRRLPGRGTGKGIDVDHIHALYDQLGRAIGQPRLGRESPHTGLRSLEPIAISLWSEPYLLIIDDVGASDFCRYLAPPRALLPQACRASVIVTSSRARVADAVCSAWSATRLDLQGLSARDSYMLLQRYLGRERVHADPDGIADLQRSLAGVPRHLQIASRTLLDRPSLPVHEYARQVREHITTLEDSTNQRHSPHAPHQPGKRPGKRPGKGQDERLDRPDGLLASFDRVTAGLPAPAWSLLRALAYFDTQAMGRADECALENAHRSAVDAAPHPPGDASLAWLQAAADIASIAVTRSHVAELLDRHLIECTAEPAAISESSAEDASAAARYRIAPAFAPMARSLLAGGERVAIITRLLQHARTVAADMELRAAWSIAISQWPDWRQLLDTLVGHIFDRAQTREHAPHDGDSPSHGLPHPLIIDRWGDALVAIVTALAPLLEQRRDRDAYSWLRAAAGYAWVRGWPAQEGRLRLALGRHGLQTFADRGRVLRHFDIATERFIAANMRDMAADAAANAGLTLLQRAEIAGSQARFERVDSLLGPTVLIGDPSHQAQARRLCHLNNIQLIRTRSTAAAPWHEALAPLCQVAAAGPHNVHDVHTPHDLNAVALVAACNAAAIAATLSARQRAAYPHSDRAPIPTIPSVLAAWQALHQFAQPSPSQSQSPRDRDISALDSVGEAPLFEAWLYTLLAHLEPMAEPPPSSTNTGQITDELRANHRFCLRQRWLNNLRSINRAAAARREDAATWPPLRSGVGLHAPLANVSAQGLWQLGEAASGVRRYLTANSAADSTADSTADSAAISAAVGAAADNGPITQGQASLSTLTAARLPAAVARGYILVDAARTMPLIHSDLSPLLMLVPVAPLAAVFRGEFLARSLAAIATAAGRYSPVYAELCALTALQTQPAKPKIYATPQP